MSKKSRTKKKAKKVTKKTARKILKRRPVKKVKKTVKKVKKSKAVKKTRKVAKVKKMKVAKKASAAKQKMVRHVAERVMGKVTHYYDRIGVAVVAVQEPIRVGDTILLKSGERVFEQKVESLQVNHTPIAAAARGQEVGMKVNEVASEGTLILAA